MLVRKTIVCSRCLCLNKVDLSRASSKEAHCGKCGSALDLKTARAVTYQQFSTILKSSELPVVVDAFAEWCSPCRSYAPIFQEVANTEFQKANFFKMDTDAQPGFSQQFQIRGIPATLFFKNSNLVRFQPGLLNAQQLRELVGEVARS